MFTSIIEILTGGVFLAGNLTAYFLFKKWRSEYGPDGHIVSPEKKSQLVKTDWTMEVIFYCGLAASGSIWLAMIVLAFHHPDKPHYSFNEPFLLQNQPAITTHPTAFSSGNFDGPLNHDVPSELPEIKEKHDTQRVLEQSYNNSDESEPSAIVEPLKPEPIKEPQSKSKSSQH